MSRIPDVRTWNVRLRDARGKLVLIVQVDAPTRWLARVAGQDALMRAIGGSKYVQTLHRGGKMTLTSLGTRKEQA